MKVPLPGGCYAGRATAGTGREARLLAASRSSWRSGRMMRPDSIQAMVEAMVNFDKLDEPAFARIKFERREASSKEFMP